MNSIFKSFKEEIFFLRRLFQEGFSLKHFLNYFKNRYFWRFFISGTPRFKQGLKDDFELHVLCRKKDLWMLIWALSSFLFHSKLNPEIFVHDDGTLDDKTVKLLENKFINLAVIKKKEADRFVNNYPGINPKVLSFREKGHKLVLKLTDSLLLAKSEKVMIMDSDILFFNRPQEIVDFIRGKLHKDALISRNYGDQPYDLMMNPDYGKGVNYNLAAAGFMNSGIIVFNRSKIRYADLIYYLDNTKRKIDDYLLEMAGWSFLISSLNFEFLSPERYIIKGRPNENIVAKHFTSPRRYEFFAYGIDMARRLM